MVIGNALYMCSISITLPLMFMMILTHIGLDECPRFLSDTLSTNNHLIYLSEYILRLPLKRDGMISYLP